MLPQGSANIKRRGLPFMIACALAVFLTPAEGWTHSVHVFAYVDGEQVVTESYFSDGRKCRDSTIEVLDPTGAKLVEGTTDENGRFAFRPKEKADLLIRLTAPMGHRAEYRLSAAELPGGLPEGTVSPQETPSAEAADRPSGTTTVCSAAEVEKAIDDALARRLAPIRRELEELQRERRVSDVIGGIGYIVGLMGLVLYFRSRGRRGQ